MQFDSVQVGVDALDEATRDYEVLLGVSARPSGEGQRLQLRRGAVELEPGDPGLRSLRFVLALGASPTAWPSGPESFHGLRVHVGPPSDAQLPGAPRVDAIDHVVIHSPSLDRAITLWRDRLGLRLALDREFPARGLRMLFFRSAGVTLEFVGTLGTPQDASGPDRLYGIAYRVSHLDACRTRLLQAGFDVSAIRDGQKRGTTVATVRSRTAGVPTLLIGEATPRGDSFESTAES